MTAQLSPQPRFQAFGPNGQFLVGGQLFTYAAGTSTPQATYIDSTQTTPNTNPVILDALGSAPVWLDPAKAYKYVLQDSAGNRIYTTDNIGGVLTTAYNVLNYGADPTGATDSTVAITNAHATGHVIYYPAGTYLVSSAIPIPGGGIIGDGIAQTFIVDTSTGTTNTYNYTGTGAGLFRDFEITTATKTGGYAITVQPTSGEVFGMHFFQMMTSGMPGGINFVAASGWTVIACNFINYNSSGLLVNNTNNADSGDSCVIGCQFNAFGNTTGTGIQLLESGGLRVTGNKFNNGNIGVELNLGATSTSDLIITGNSFENAHQYNIVLVRQGGSSAVFTNVVITGNQFLIASATNASYGIWSSQAALFLFTLTITGNVFQVSDTGAAAAILLDWVTDCVIESNVIRGSGGSSVGILVGPNGGNVVVGPNTCSHLSQSVEFGATINVIAPYLQTGTLNVATSTANGTLFYGTGTVTYPTAFSPGLAIRLIDCEVIITTAGGGGGIACNVISATQTQLFFMVSGVTNGGSVPVQWSVRGYI